MKDLVAITGPIAAGATTLTTRLSECTGWHAFLEPDVEKNNPFFAKYHGDPGRFAFHNQVTFLTKSAESHRAIAKQESPDGICLEDYCPFEHTEVYAHVLREFDLLSAEEYSVVQRLTEILAEDFIGPSLLIYRKLSPELLRRRIQDRGRPSEQSLKLDFLEAIRRRFDSWASSWKRSPVLSVEESLDALTDSEGVARLKKRILEMLTDKNGP